MGGTKGEKEGLKYQQFVVTRELRDGIARSAIEVGIALDCSPVLRPGPLCGLVLRSFLKLPLAEQVAFARRGLAAEVDAPSDRPTGRHGVGRATAVDEFIEKRGKVRRRGRKGEKMSA